MLSLLQATLLRHPKTTQNYNFTLSLLVNELFENYTQFLNASGRLEPTLIASRSDPHQRISQFSTVLKDGIEPYSAACQL
jgi:hypothetical protein